MSRAVANGALHKRAVLTTESVGADALALNTSAVLRAVVFARFELAVGADETLGAFAHARLA